MKLTLEIPKKENKKEIEKVYETEGYDLPFEIVDSVLEALDFSDDKEALGTAVLKSVKKIKPLMLDIFDGLTEEELGRVGTSKLVPIIFQIFIETKNQLTVEIKNVMKEYKK